MKKIRKGKKMLLIILIAIIAIIAAIVITNIVKNISSGPEVPIDETAQVIPLPETTYSDMEVKNIEIKPEEEQTYTDLYNSGILPEIATENPNMTETEIAEKAKELAKTYPIEERLLRRLIRVQLPNSASIVYDLDYDNQLQAALEVIKTKDFDSSLKSTKSLKELQEEAKQKDENGKVVATK
jgi:hypothetical protein